MGNQGEEEPHKKGRLALWHATAPMLMAANPNPSRVGVRAAVGNVKRNASGLERAAKRYRLPAEAASSLAGH